MIHVFNPHLEVGQSSPRWADYCFFILLGTKGPNVVNKSSCQVRISQNLQVSMIILMFLKLYPCIDQFNPYSNCQSSGIKNHVWRNIYFHLFFFLSFIFNILTIKFLEKFDANSLRVKTELKVKTELNKTLVWDREKLNIGIHIIQHRS